MAYLDRDSRLADGCEEVCDFAAQLGIRWQCACLDQGIQLVIEEPIDLQSHQHSMHTHCKCTNLNSPSLQVGEPFQQFQRSQRCQLIIRREALLQRRYARTRYNTAWAIIVTVLPTRQDLHTLCKLHLQLLEALASTVCVGRWCLRLFCFYAIDGAVPVQAPCFVDCLQFCKWSVFSQTVSGVALACMFGCVIQTNVDCFQCEQIGSNMHNCGTDKKCGDIPRKLEIYRKTHAAALSLPASSQHSVYLLSHHIRLHVLRCGVLLYNQSYSSCHLARKVAEDLDVKISPWQPSVRRGRHLAFNVHPISSAGHQIRHKTIRSRGQQAYHL